MSEILSVNTPSFDNVYDQWITFNCSCGDKIDFWGDIHLMMEKIFSSNQQLL